MKSFYPFIVSASLALLLCSCSRIEGRLHILAGNFYTSQAQYNEAIAAYMNAASHPDLRPYTDYALGVCYYYLDEKKLALEKWTLTNKAAEPELAFRMHYNRGIALYESGDFPAAARAFRAALELDSSRIEAKRNMELSLYFQNRPVPTPAASNTSYGDSELSDFLFDYIRLKEQSRWASTTQIEEESDGPDY
ncbi:hypothetical protein FACS1894200_04210 [Spirochaetia bacterium]|nr:hypothetical protein FACS1894200_04210 [Spirochaetia bacterium]